MTKLRALAVDYDGTLATDGVVPERVITQLARAKRQGTRLVLVSGREREDLARTFSHLDLFHRAVLENGALLVCPRSGREQTLADPPPTSFADALRAFGVTPLSFGRVIVATTKRNEEVVHSTIRSAGLELQTIFNKDAVMVLPSGINKATGLAAALAEIDLPADSVVAIGDAENDHSLLAACGIGVAVANAVASLKAEADWLSPSARGDGVIETIARYFPASS